MLDHLELSVQNLSRSQEFYRAALAPLGYGLHVTSEVRGFGVDKDNLDFWLRAGEASSPRPHFAFRCATRAVADRGYAAAIREVSITADQSGCRIFIPTTTLALS